jgi:hypothetical protein
MKEEKIEAEKVRYVTLPSNKTPKWLCGSITTINTMESVECHNALVSRQPSESETAT